MNLSGRFSISCAAAAAKSVAGMAAAVWVASLPASPPAWSRSLSCREAVRSLPRSPSDPSVSADDCATLKAKFNRQWTLLEFLRADPRLCGLTPNQLSQLSWAVLAIDQNLQRRCGATTRLHLIPETAEARVARELSETAELLEHYVSGFTRLRLDDAHGAQVEYNAPDGRSYLWYPGALRVTPGFWRVDETMAPDGIHHPSRICYLYGSNSIDPTNGAVGGHWQCAMGWSFVINTRDRKAGDIFALSSHLSPPFELDGRPQSLAELQRQRPAIRKR